MTYAIFHLNEWTCELQVGRATLKIRFTGGGNTKYGPIPAVFRTTSRAIAHIIETCDLFKKGVIKAIDDKVQTMVFETHAEAVDYLHTRYNVRRADLLDIEAVKAIANSLGINIRFGKKK